MSYDTDPPSDSLMTSLRTAINYDAGQIIANGGNKVARVRIEIEFGSGEAIAVERTPKPYAYGS